MIENLSEIKRQALQALKLNLVEKLERIQSEYMLYRESAANETKSTAGDKHDTSKSMMQLEQEKLGSQLVLMKEQLKVFQKLESFDIQKTISFGSIVSTKESYFLIGISSGKLEISGLTKPIFFVSAQTPIGKFLLGKTAGYTGNFNGKPYTIEAFE